MNQRVNIQYSIDLDDLPTEVIRLLGIAFTKLRSTTTDGPDGILNNKELLSLGSVETISSLRQSLAEVDYMLEDVTNIINGYISFKSRPPQSETTTENTSERDGSEFMEKLKEFQELVGEDENPD